MLVIINKVISNVSGLSGLFDWYLVAKYQTLSKGKAKNNVLFLPLYSSLTFCLEHIMRFTSSTMLMSEMLFNITVLRNNTSSPNLLAA